MRFHSIRSRLLVSFAFLSLLSCLLSLAIWFLVSPTAYLGEAYPGRKAELRWITKVLTPRFIQALEILDRDDGKSLNLLLQDCAPFSAQGMKPIRISVFDSERKYLAGVQTDPSQTLSSDFRELKLSLKGNRTKATTALVSGKKILGFLEMDYPTHSPAISHGQKTRGLLILSLVLGLLILIFGGWTSKRWIHQPVINLGQKLDGEISALGFQVHSLSQALTNLNRHALLQKNESSMLGETLEELNEAILEITVEREKEPWEPEFLFPESLEQNFSQVQAIFGDTEAFLKSLRETMARGDVLTLNAFVEANRCGESAQGFSVVAEELRDLHRKSQSLLNEFTQRMVDWRNALDSGAKLSAKLHEYCKLLTHNLENIRQVSEKISETQEICQRKSLRLADGFRIQSQSIRDFSAILDIVARAEQQLREHKKFFLRFQNELSTLIDGGHHEQDATGLTTLDRHS
jgi:hypothetical protein